ncbi:MAG: N-acetylmuramoyl-L-alanine amidase, partial [Butyricicoccus sp.]|nr:N-acetylmuramoyl-L-alanine amidase [Butyricicoccus sp.]
YMVHGKLCVVDIPLGSIRKVKIVQLGSQTMGQWYNGQTDKPKYMLNASLWDEKGPIGTIWLDGKLTRNEGTGYGFGVNKNGDCGFADPWSVAWRDYITGYPSLIELGRPTAYRVDNYVQNAMTKRACIANAAGHLYFITGESLTLDDLRDELTAFGAYNAINLDGGGSARLMVDGKAINHPTDNRACKLAIAVWVKQANGDEPETEDKHMGKKVFLGVGHGGNDPGAGADGFKEKDITLTMALACKKELERHGVTVGISRTRDEDDPLTEEIQECNAFAPDVAVDIHVNAGGGDGFEAFHTLGGGTGKVLAQNIEAEVKALGQNSRGCKTRANSAGKDYYGFIRQTVCPAVICEIGFIDNAKDRAAFDTKAEQEAFGRAYARGILTTIGMKHLPEDESAPDAATDTELQALAQEVQKKFGFEEQTMQYLLAYPYARALLERLKGVG